MSAQIDPVCKNCGHETSELRQKLATNGTRMVAYQCLGCGRASSHWLKISTVPNAASLAQWDPTISDRYYERQREQLNARLGKIQAFQQLQQQEWWDQYNQYLRTPAWRSRRALVLQRAGGWCEGCRKSEATQVHHLTYEHVCNEFLWELVAICDECHERVHESK